MNSKALRKLRLQFLALRLLVTRTKDEPLRYGSRESDKWRILHGWVAAQHGSCGRLKTAYEKNSKLPAGNISQNINITGGTP